MAEEKITSERAVRIAIAICRLLEYIHNHGIVHREFRPEHILVGAEDHIKMIDFGAAGQQQENWSTRNIAAHRHLRAGR